MHLGRVGLWTFQLDLQPAPAAREAAAELEALGYPSLWLPQAVGREPFVNSALLLAATEELTVATGVASVWARDAQAMASGQLTLCEAHPGRFLLGIGVSHQPMVDFVRGHHYEKPLTKMRGYLDQMDQMLYRDLAVPPGQSLSVSFLYRTRMSTSIVTTASTRTGWFHGDPLAVVAGNFISSSAAGASAPQDSFMVYVGAPVDDAACVYSDGVTHRRG